MRNADNHTGWEIQGLADGGWEVIYVNYPQNTPVVFTDHQEAVDQMAELKIFSGLEMRVYESLSTKEKK
jgi:hypothetical protein